MRKHVAHSPNMSIPNKVGKPLNNTKAEYLDTSSHLATTSNVRTPKEPEMLRAALMYMGQGDAPFAASSSAELFDNEPDMSGVEENVDTKARVMHEGRSRVK